MLYKTSELCQLCLSQIYSMFLLIVIFSVTSLLLCAITYLNLYLLLQISIIVLLARPQQIHVIPQANYLSSMNVRPGEGALSTGTMLLLDKQISHLKEEMRMVETLLEKMQLQHALLKAQLQDVSVLRDRMTQ